MSRLFAGTPFDIPPTCDDCGKLESECVCTAEEKAKSEAARRRDADRLPPEKQTARILVQKRKGGRQVTVVKGLTSKGNDLPALLAQLQTTCGSGGTVKASEDLIELQGDHADKVCELLTRVGFRIR